MLFFQTYLGDIMKDLTPYEFYSGEFITTVDRKEEVITTDERGGWSRTYSLTFKELLEYANQWDVKVDLTKSNKTIAKIATNIILANNAVKHGLDPFRYIPKTEKITDPCDLEIIENFETLFNKYSSDKIISLMNGNIKEKIKQGS